MDKKDDLAEAFDVSEEKLQTLREEDRGTSGFAGMATWNSYGIPVPRRIVMPKHEIVCEVPLNLGPWLTRQRLRQDGELRAHITAGTIRHYTDAVVISLYNKKLGKNEICVERSVARAVWKLLKFRVSQWWARKFPKKSRLAELL